MKKKEQHTLTDLKFFKAYEEYIKTEKTRKITIDDVCKKANLHRQTFYHHFENREAFLEAFIKQQFSPFFLKAREANSVKETLLLFLEYAKRKGDVLQYLFQDKIATEYLGSYFREQYLLLEKEKNISHAVSVFMAGGLTMLIREAYVYNYRNIEEITKLIDKLDSFTYSI